MEGQRKTVEDSKCSRKTVLEGQRQIYENAFSPRFSLTSRRSWVRPLCVPLAQNPKENMIQKKPELWGPVFAPKNRYFSRTCFSCCRNMWKKLRTLALSLRDCCIWHPAVGRAKSNGNRTQKNIYSTCFSRFGPWAPPPPYFFACPFRSFVSRKKRKK